jgi:hypothetical protein
MAERMSLTWSLSEAGCAAPSTAKTRHDVWPQHRFAAQSGILGSSPQTAEAAALAELEADQTVEAKQRRAADGPGYRQDGHASLHRDTNLLPCGNSFERTITRGRKPQNCPSCR